jgi:hypothetical protein
LLVLIESDGDLRTLRLGPEEDSVFKLPGSVLSKSVLNAKDISSAGAEPFHRARLRDPPITNAVSALTKFGSESPSMGTFLLNVSSLNSVGFLMDF